MVVKLIINNSYSQITGLTSEPFNRLKKLLSYNTDPSAAYFAGGNYPRVKYMIDNKGNFPSGLLIQVAWFLADNDISGTVEDNRSRPAPRTTRTTFKSKYEPYKAQLDAVSAAVEQQRGTISMPTGTGKSLVIALIVAKLNVKTLIVVPNLGIKKQLIEDLNSLYADASHITVENIDSAALMFANGYDCLIIDEAHHVAAKTYQKLNKLKWNDIYYRFFLTATPFRNNTEETLLFQAIAGEVIYQLTYKDAIKLGYIVPVEAYYIEVPTTKTEAYTWAEVYSQLVVHNEVRNNMIAELLLKLGSQGISTLCLVKEIKHGTILADLTTIPFANGADDESRVWVEHFNTGKLKPLIGTEGILSEGVDTKPCEFVIICGLGKAKSALMQKIGRGIRTYPGKKSCKVILFKDNSHKFTKAHFKTQCSIIFDEYGIKPIKLDIDK